MFSLSNDGINANPIILVPYVDKPELTLASMIKYIRNIEKTLPKPYTLFVSAGVDSQAMLYAWELSGVEYQAVNVAYNGFNDHDRVEIFKFAKNHDIEIEELNFDVISFLEKSLDQYTNKYRCASPQICTHMAFSELVSDGTKFFSGNFPMSGYPQLDNTIFGLQRYATLTDTPLIPFFLSEGEHAAKAFSMSNDLAKDYKINSFDPYLVKCQIYTTLGFPVIPQTIKLTGFEKLKDHYDGFPERVTSKMKLRHASLPSRRVFDQLFRNPYLIEFGNHYPVRFEQKDGL